MKDAIPLALLAAALAAASAHAQAPADPIHVRRGATAAPSTGAGTVASVPAALRPAAPRAAAARPAADGDLPGSDTSFTRGPAPAVLHTVGRTARVVESGISHGDGTVCTARSEWREDTRRLPLGLAPGSLAHAYTAELSGGAGEGAYQVERQGRRLKVAVTRGGATRETLVPIPQDVMWAVAEPGMEEHLVPALLRFPVGTAGVKLAVYRPSAGRWDTFHAAVGPLPGARLVTLVAPAAAGAAPGPVHLVITDEGDLLAAQGTGPGAWERLPAPGSRRSEKVEDLVAMVKGADGLPASVRSAAQR